MASPTEIEERLAHLSRAVEDLSETVLAQSREIDILTRRVTLLMQREAARESDTGATLPMADWRPPHW